jgi:hypothetical protein
MIPDDDIPATLDTKRHNERIHFRAARTTVAMLSELKKLHGMSMSDSIRKGIALFMIAKRGEAKSQRLALVNEDGSIATEINLV